MEEYTFRKKWPTTIKKVDISDVTHFNYIMRTARDWSDAEYRELVADKNNQLKCFHCGSGLMCYCSQSIKMLQTMEGPIKYKPLYFRCSDEDCKRPSFFKLDHPKAIYNREFGSDVMLAIMKKHILERKNPLQIHDELRTGEVDISRSHTYTLNTHLQKLGKGWMEDDTLELIRKQGFIVIQIDATRGSEHGESLYTFKDAHSGRTLCIRFFVRASAADIANEIDMIMQRFQVPIIGAISDKAQNILGGVQEILPDLPHQYCLVHFIRHITKPMNDFDHEVRNAVNTRLKDASPLKTTAKNIISEETDNPNTELVEKLRAEVKHVLSTGRMSPVFPVSLEIRDTMVELTGKVNGELQTLERTGRSDARIIRNLQRSVETVEEILEEFRADFDFLELQSNFCIDFQRYVFDNTEDSIESRFKIRCLLDSEFHRVLDERYLERWNIFLDNARTAYSRHFEGLFVNRMFPLIPSHNNGIESSFNSYKRFFRGNLGTREIGRSFAEHVEDVGYLVDVRKNDLDRRFNEWTASDTRDFLIIARKHACSRKSKSFLGNWRKEYRKNLRERISYKTERI